TAGTGEEARSSACRTARYRRSPPLPQALRADTAAGPLRADRLPCRAAADRGNPQNTPERQALRSAPLTPPPLPSRPRQIESEDHDRFSTSVVCHELLHPITLPVAMPLIFLWIAGIAACRVAALLAALRPP